MGNEDHGKGSEKEEREREKENQWAGYSNHALFFLYSKSFLMFVDFL
jgi:hypothetical protein